MWQIVAAFTGPIVVVLLAILGVLFRATTRWTKLETSVRHMEQSATDSQTQNRQVHIEIYQQMREDRAATDRRLRWLEEHIWNMGTNERRG